MGKPPLWYGNRPNSYFWFGNYKVITSGQNMHCAMTGQKLNDPSDGVWDDGEWISWNWINGQLDGRELEDEFPTASSELIDLFQRFVEAAIDHRDLTGNYLQIWGELGELYAEIRFGIKRHRPKTQGSDGKLCNDFVETKTISPEKSTSTVHVKRAGNFNKLLVIKISEEFEFEGRMVDRRGLGKSRATRAAISWEAMAK
jgi:hypothetical protein